MRAKWLEFWRAFAPLWATLWLVSSLATPVLAWGHVDGSPCATCSRALASYVEPEECCSHATTFSLHVTNCRDCCQVTSHQSHPDMHWGQPLVALVPTVFVLPLPHYREEHHHWLPDVRYLLLPSRGPPRGRAPPLNDSLSPS